MFSRWAHHPYQSLLVDFKTSQYPDSSKSKDHVESCQWFLRQEEMDAQWTWINIQPNIIYSNSLLSLLSWRMTLSISSWRRKTYFNCCTFSTISVASISRTLSFEFLRLQQTSYEGGPHRISIRQRLNLNLGRIWSSTAKNQFILQRFLFTPSTLFKQNDWGYKAPPPSSRTLKTKSPERVRASFLCTSILVRQLPNTRIMSIPAGNLVKCASFNLQSAGPNSMSIHDSGTKICSNVIHVAIRGGDLVFH